MEKVVVEVKTSNEFDIMFDSEEEKLEFLKNVMDVINQSDELEGSFRLHPVNLNIEAPIREDVIVKYNMNELVIYLGVESNLIDNLPENVH